ncbi:hypothetical protein ACH5RR_015119 [Cinchona calisaya]|uniref:Uncharacterized protein n=1 Tax=Cinchona calisaya TaxID=153742 RepID=A0ABD2ZVP3_9GENT
MPAQCRSNSTMGGSFKVGPSIPFSASSSPQPSLSTGAPSTLVPQLTPHEKSEFRMDDVADTSAAGDTRALIWTQRYTFNNSKYVVRELNNIIKGLWNDKCINWTSTPLHVRDLWWNEFKCHFKWEERHEIKVYRVFRKKVGDYLRNRMYRAKATKKKATFIQRENWGDISNNWNPKASQMKNKRNKNNRVDEASQGSPHARGLVNMGQHKKRLTQSLGQPPAFLETFQEGYNEKKGNTWSGPHTHAIHKSYNGHLRARIHKAPSSCAGESSEASVNNMFALPSSSSTIVREADVNQLRAKHKLVSQAEVNQVRAEVNQLQARLRQKDEELLSMRKKLDALFELATKLRPEVYQELHVNSLPSNPANDVPNGN